MQGAKAYTLGPALPNTFRGAESREAAPQSNPMDLNHKFLMIFLNLKITASIVRLKIFHESQLLGNINSQVLISLHNNPKFHPKS